MEISPEELTQLKADLYNAKTNLSKIEQDYEELSDCLNKLAGAVFEHIPYIELGDVGETKTVTQRLVTYAQNGRALISNHKNQ